MRRPQDDRWLAGVCSGVARSLGVDPLIVRLGAIVLSLFGGAGLLLYLLGVLLIPADGEQDSMARKAIDGEGRAPVLGLLLVGLVLWGAVSDGWFFGWDWGWGIGPVVIGGLAVLWYLRREDRERETTAVAAAPDAEPGAEAPTAVVNPPRPRRSSGRIALGVTLAGIALVGAIAAVAGDDVRWDILLASTVIALGAALVAAAPFGGARALIPLGLLLATGAGVAAAADLQLEGGAGERVYRPKVWSQIKSEYQLAAGRQEVDLRKLALPDGTTKVKLEQGFGELVVRLPEHARATIDARVSGGDIEALGHEDNGFDADVVTTDGSRGPTIAVDAHLGFGYIAVVRGDDPIGHRNNRHFGPGAISLGGLR